MAGDPIDRTNEEWLHALSGQSRSDAAVEELRRYLVLGLYKALGRRGVSDDNIEDYAQEAVVRILASLEGFRGDAKFTTWAMAVAVRTAFGEMRRSRYRRVNEGLDSESLERAIENAEAPGTDAGLDLDRAAILNALHRAIREELTPRQRKAVLSELAGVPSELLAEQMGMKRNALYKLHHDARKKLAVALAERGYSELEVRNGFGDPTKEQVR